MQDDDLEPGHAGLLSSPLVDTNNSSHREPAAESSEVWADSACERMRGAGSQSQTSGRSANSNIAADASPEVWVHPQLQGLLLTLRQSASTMAHDMRNPLTLVLAMSDLLRKKEEGTAEMRQQCSVVHVRPRSMLSACAGLLH